MSTDPRVALTILEQAAHAAGQAALEQTAKETQNEVAVDVTLGGVEGTLSREVKGWRVVAYVKKLWHGPIDAGGRLSKRFLVPSRSRWFWRF